MKIGMYMFIFVVCECELEGLIVEGYIVWKNFMGYLFGRMVFIMLFYVFMVFVYGLLGVFWFF